MGRCLPCCSGWSDYCETDISKSAMIIVYNHVSICYYVHKTELFKWNWLGGLSGEGFGGHPIFKAGTQKTQ